MALTPAEKQRRYRDRKLTLKEQASRVATADPQYRDLSSNKRYWLAWHEIMGYLFKNGIKDLQPEITRLRIIYDIVDFDRGIDSQYLLGERCKNEDEYTYLWTISGKIDHQIREAIRSCDGQNIDYLRDYYTRANTLSFWNPKRLPPNIAKIEADKKEKASLLKQIEIKKIQDEQLEIQRLEIERLGDIRRDIINHAESYLEAQQAHDDNEVKEKAFIESHPVLGIDEIEILLDQHKTIAEILNVEVVE